RRVCGVARCVAGKAPWVAAGVLTSTRLSSPHAEADGPYRGPRCSETPTPAGAQAGRRGGAGPVGACLAVRTPPTASFSSHGPERTRNTRLRPAEPAVELPVVPAVYVAVPVEVEVPQVARVGGARPERGPEAVAVPLIHVPVAVRVAEQPEEAVHPVAARGAVAVPVQFPSPAVVDVVREDRQGVVAVRQQAADELCPGEGEHGDRLAADQGDADLRVHQGAVLPAQLDRPGVEDRGTPKGDGDAVDLGALGRAVVDYDAFDLPRNAG